MQSRPRIVKNKQGKLEVKSVGKNGKLMQDSNPQQFSRKSGCYTNIRGMMSCFNTEVGVHVQDETGPKPIVIYVTHDKVESSTVPPFKPYVQAWQKKKKSK